MKKLRFEFYRKRAKLTQADVGMKLGVSGAAVCQWENGANLPNAKRLCEIAKLYKCRVDDLLKEEI